MADVFGVKVRKRLNNLHDNASQLVLVLQFEFAETVMGYVLHHNVGGVLLFFDVKSFVSAN